MIKAKGEWCSCWVFPLRRKVGLSRSVLAQRFSDLFGHQRNVWRAGVYILHRKMLLHSNKSLALVVEQVGYESATRALACRILAAV
jgi:AraC-like DNA-binding protein